MNIPAAAAGPSSRPTLVRAMGVWGLTGSIVNITVAGSIFVLPATLGATLGAAAPIAYLLGALLFVPLVLSIAAVGSRIVASGGPYVYVEAAFGRFPGYLIASLLWISAIAGSGGLAAALADQVAQAIPSLAAPVPRAALLSSVYGLLVVINALGVRSGTRANAVLAVAKTLPLLLIVALGFQQARWDHFAIVQWPDTHALGTAMILVVFAYSGVETALAPSGEMRHNDRVVPVAVSVGVGLVICLYVAVQAVCQGVLGPALAGHAAPVSAVADRVLPHGGTLVVATAAAALVGCLQGDLLGTSRLLYAMACDGLLPRALARVTPRSRVPIVAIIAHAAVALLLALGGTFNTLALVAGGSFCFVYIGCAAAAWQLQRLDISQTPEPMRLPGGPWIPGIGILGFALILATLSTREWIAIAAAMAVIGALYGLIRARPAG